MQKYHKEILYGFVLCVLSFVIIKGATLFVSATLWGLHLLTLLFVSMLKQRKKQ